MFDPNIKYRVVDDKVEEIHTVTVYSFSVGDVDDPDIYAGQPLYDWQQSDQGQWVMEHSIETPSWHRMVDMSMMGHRYAISAKLRAKDLTYFLLKWGKTMRQNV
jgi:hypothetical protein